MQNKKGKSKTTWKEIKSHLMFGMYTICSLILKDSVWLDTLGAKLGKSAANVVYIAVMILVGVALSGILAIIDRIIEKTYPDKKSLLKPMFNGRQTGYFGGTLWRKMKIRKQPN